MKNSFPRSKKKTREGSSSRDSIFHVLHVFCLVSTLSTMITPVFRLSQDNKHVNLYIQAPHAKLSNSELIIDEGTEVKFFASPYFLR